MSAGQGAVARRTGINPEIQTNSWTRPRQDRIHRGLVDQHTPVLLRGLCEAAQRGIRKYHTQKYRQFGIGAARSLEIQRTHVHRNTQKVGDRMRGEHTRRSAPEGARRDSLPCLVRFIVH